MFRSTTIFRELAIEPGKSYIDMKTFSKFMSLIVAEHSTQHTIHSTQYTAHSTQYTVHNTQHTVHSTHAILEHAATPPHNK